MVAQLLYSLLALAAVNFAVSSATDPSKAPSLPRPPNTLRLANGTVVPRAAALGFSASQWIWTNDVSASVAPTGARAFRKDFVAPQGKTPVQAEIIMVADDSFTLFVNGAEVGAGGDFTVSERFCVPLQPCLNVFAVTAVNGGTVPNFAGLLAAIQITYSDGTTSTIVSDTTWHASLQVPAGYQQPSFDDNSWTPAVAEGAYGIGPWGQIPVPSPPPVLSLTTANWIWTNEVVNGNAPPAARAFRRTYTPPTGQTAASAKIIIIADDEYSLYINGVLVGSGTDFSVAQTYTVNLSPAPSLVFAVYAVNAGDGNNPAGLLAAIQITLTDSCTSGLTFVTDGSWKSNTGTPVGFQLPGFDDSSWPAATVEGPYGMAPWGNVTIASSSGPATALPGAPASQATAA
ncbi:lectin [Mycena latifolia]|nr:lectin [Mycena latifolia]